jgi:hypothetical protein
LIVRGIGRRRTQGYKMRWPIMKGIRLWIISGSCFLRKLGSRKKIYWFLKAKYNSWFSTTKVCWRKIKSWGICLKERNPKSIN